MALWDNGLIAVSRQELREFVAGFLDVLRRELTGFTRFSPRPGFIQRIVFARRAPHSPDRHEVHAHVTLRQGMQPAQDFAGHRLPVRHDQRQMERAIEIADVAECGRTPGDLGA